MDRGTIRASRNEILYLRVDPLNRTSQTPNLNVISEDVRAHLPHIEASDLSEQEEKSIANVLETIRNNTEGVIDNRSIAREQPGHHEQGTALDEEEEDADWVRRRTATSSSTVSGRRLGTPSYYSVTRSHPTRHDNTNNSCCYHGDNSCSEKDSIDH